MNEITKAELATIIEKAIGAETGVKREGDVVTVYDGNAEPLFKIEIGPADYPRKMLRRSD